jgi:hypothetical protein
MDSKPKPKGQWVGNLRMENGGEIVSDTALHAVDCYAIVVESEAGAVISALTQPYIVNSDARVGVNYPQGFVIYGYTTSITLTSGTVACSNF